MGRSAQPGVDGAAGGIAVLDRRKVFLSVFLSIRSDPPETDPHVMHHPTVGAVRAPTMMGTVRREVRIRRSADDVWAVVGDPASMAEWFPGVTDCVVDGNQRVITTAAGLPVPEELLVVDPLQRRLQYRVTAPIVRWHLGTLDVIDLEDGTSLVVSSTNAEPATLALVFGGATGHALGALKRQLEASTA